ENRLEMPLVRLAVSGLNAAVTARLETRSASVFSTSSNCLPPLTEDENACVIARAKPPALVVSACVLTVRSSSVREVSCRLGSSVIGFSLARRIGKTRQQIVEFSPLQRRGRGSPDRVN